MQPTQLDLEKAQFKYEVYKRLVSLPEWQYFVKDMKEVVQVHKDYAVSFGQQEKIDESIRQALLILGIEEAVSRPMDIVNQYENVTNRITRNFCQLCGQVTHKVKEILK